jgi:hypothetical protein
MAMLIIPVSWLVVIFQPADAEHFKPTRKMKSIRAPVENSALLDTLPVKPRSLDLRARGDPHMAAACFIHLTGGTDSCLTPHSPRVALKSY